MRNTCQYIGPWGLRSIVSRCRRIIIWMRRSKGRDCCGRSALFVGWMIRRARKKKKPNIRTAIQQYTRAHDILRIIHYAFIETRNTFFFVDRTYLCSGWLYFVGRNCRHTVTTSVVECPPFCPARASWSCDLRNGTQ